MKSINCQWGGLDTACKNSRVFIMIYYFNQIARGTYGRYSRMALDGLLSVVMLPYFYALAGSEGLALALS